LTDAVVGVYRTVMPPEPIPPTSAEEMARAAEAAAAQVNANREEKKVTLWDVLGSCEKVHVDLLKGGEDVDDEYCGRHDKKKFLEDPDFIGNRFGYGLYRVRGLTADGTFAKGQHVELKYNKQAFPRPVMKPPEPKPGSVPDPTLGALAILTPLIAALRPADVPRSDPMDMAIRIAELVNGKKESTSADPEKLMTMFMQGIAMAREMNGGAGGINWDVVVKAIETTLGRGLDIYERAVLLPGWDPKTRTVITQRPPRDVTPSPAKPGDPPPVAPAAGAPPTNGHKPPEVDAKVRELIGAILERARLDMDNEEAANQIVGHIPPIVYPQFLRWLFAKDSVQIIKQVEPELVKYSQWLDETWKFAQAIGQHLIDSGHKPEPDPTPTTTAPAAGG